jgi:hypothetical protein
MNDFPRGEIFHLGKVLPLELRHSKGFLRILRKTPNYSYLPLPKKKSTTGLIDNDSLKKLTNFKIDCWIRIFF